MGPVNGKVYRDSEGIIRTPDLKNEKYPGGIGLFIFNQMNKHKEKIAQIDAVTGKQETYGNLLQRCLKSAIAMKHKGVKSKDIVTLCSYNHLDVCVPYIATLFLGAIPTSVDPSMSSHDTIHLLSLVEPKMIFVVPEAVDLIQTAVEAGNFQSEIIIFDETFDEFYETVEKDEDFKVYEVGDSKETAVILFSSGTTGLPKGICLNHYAYLNILENQVKGVDLDMALSYSTFYWITGVSLLIASMFNGSTRLILREFNEREFWNFVDIYKVTFCFLNLAATRTLAESSIPQGIITNSVKNYVTAGEFTSPIILKRIREHFPKATVCQLYGQTEATGFITAFSMKDVDDRRFMEIKPACCGRPMLGMDYKIIDVESGKTLGPNAEGELRVKGKYLMNGYYNMDSVSAFDEDGFLITGDVLYYDEEFCFYMVDRIKEMLKFKGWHVPPQVIENVLLNHPAVSAAVVIGIPHKIDGEHPMACVILKKNFKVTEEDLTVYVNERVDDRKKLRGGVRFVDSFPRTSTGKVNRRLLKKMYVQMES